MSLVGNLEDLSLGDLLQIVSLSQKSGVLELASDRGIAQIFLRSGLVHAAGIKGTTLDLRGLLVANGLLDAARFDAALGQAGASARNDVARLVEAARLDLEQVEALVRKSAEEAIFSLFTWETGDFSFDAAKDDELDFSYARLVSGINPQFLAMEGMRLRDEQTHRSTAASVAPVESPSDGVDDLFFGSEALEVDGETGAEIELDTELDLGAAARRPKRPVSAAQAAPEAEAAAVVEAVLAPEPESSEAISQPLVVIDSDASALEWVKTSVGARAARIHVFQRAEQGLARIRQYLIRGEVPCVLLSTSLAIDPLSGIHGLGDFVRRLRAQAPRIRILGLSEAAEGDPAIAPGLFDALLRRPNRKQLRAGAGRVPDDLAETLLQALVAALRSSAPLPLQSPAGEAPRRGRS